MKGKGVLGLAALAGLVALLATACAGSPGQAAVAQASVPRDAEPSVATNDPWQLAHGNSAFALDLYGALRGQEGNLFFSPYSLSSALAMTYAGARGRTEEQMATVLHYTMPQERLHPVFNALDLQLASRGAGAKGQDGKGFRLKVANSLWGQTGYQFLPEYLETLARNYGAGLRLVDYQKAAESARAAINDWVKGETEGKIPELLAQGVVDGQTRLVLANAVYFNAAWKQPFTKEATRPAPFTLLDGTRVDVPMMSQQGGLAYARGQGYQAVELPYDGDELSLMILLPDAGSFQRFESSLMKQALEEALITLQPKQVALTMPKFKYDSSFDLAETLSGMGMADAVDPDGADFSGMTGRRDLYISDVIHKAVVAVDEQGTEAAAATAVGMRTTSAPVDVVTLSVDRPFVFLIRDTKTGTLLFLGRVLNPAG